MQEFKPLGFKLVRHVGDAGGVAARPVEVRDDTKFDRVTSHAKNDWNRAGQSFGGKCRNPPGRGDDGHPAANEIGCQFRQSAEIVLRPPEFDRQVAALDVTHFAQTFAEYR
jgi:hypothetical protein